jgi:xanthine dehydrogenase small subunit
MVMDLTGQHQIRFLLNGQPVAAQGLPPSTTLLDFVRSQGLTGSKEGCAEGECGACTVLMVKPCATGSAFVPFNSCLMLLPMAEGQEIYTVEALAREGQLAEVKAAMVEYGGSQCGYCTPGFVVSLFAEQYRPGRTGHCDPHAMSGNLCRCTGYRPIRDAALSLGPAPSGWFRDRIARKAPSVGAARYGHGESQFLRPEKLTECLEMLAAHPDARLIAGGTDLVVESNLRDRRFPVLISIEALAELRIFADTEDAVTLGAGLSLTEIGELWTNAPPVLCDWLGLFASPLIRNRATLGGNLATASPIGDGAPLLLALDATVQIAGAEGERSVPLSEFFRGYRQTALSRSEVLVSVRIPKPVREETGFYKIAKRRTDDISTVAAGISVTLDASGTVTRARFAYGGVAATPVRALEAEQAVLGRRWNASTIQLAQDVIARTLKPLSDHRGSAEYRLAIAQSVLGKYAHQQKLEDAA